MKKMIVVLLVVLFCSGSNAANAQTQTLDKAVLLNTYAIRSDNAAVKATRDLWKRVGEQKEEAWYKLPKGYLAVYTEDGIQNRYVYDSKGNWLYALLTYTEKSLPADVRGLVKSTYYDYSIGWVKEIRQGEATVYVVHVESDKEWKDLAVQDGQMQTLRTISKR
ncbi:MAG: hypothetical protein JST42_20810 [Bacteroidetes bacterium]|nr:hypothetical protein [Bacteroidota bacterium]